MSTILPPSGTPRVSRRTLIRGAAGGAAALGLGALPGCSTAGGFRSENLGASNRLRILNWELYIDEDDDGGQPTVVNAERELAMQISYEDGWDNAGSWNTIVEPALSKGQTLPYDIIVPTNWLAARMVARGWAEQLPLELIPNHKNIEPAYLTNNWDRGSRFQMPWQAGITGIAYNPELTGGEIRSIAELFSPDLNGQVSLIVEMRETVGFGMLLNGADPSRPTAETANAGLDRIEQEVRDGRVAAFTANEFAEGLTSGAYAASMAWSGDTVLLQGERPDIQFVIPDEGAIQWFDTMVIPKGSPNRAAAGLWMNYVYEPANAANITNWVQYISPVIGVADALADIGAGELAENPILFPDDETKRRLFTWGGLADAEEIELETRFNALIG
ncbi:MAG: spermidine/putrescine ABC transporter substrate-binding protein [Acidimicrobiales bacterium]